MTTLDSSQWMYASGGFYSHTIDQSLRFEDGSPAYLTKSTAAGNRRTFTISCWVKRAKLASQQLLVNTGDDGANQGGLQFLNDDTLNFYSAIGSTYYQLVTTQVFRDASAWYNIVAAYDTENTTQADRIRLYVNGVRITSFATETQPSQNYDSFWNQNSKGISLGVYEPNNSSLPFGGYMAEVNFIDGTALDADSFGETKAGIWIPKDTSGLTFGTNGFRLKFQDSSAIGDDTSGNGNDFTVSGLAATDVVLDSPTNNWCTHNSILNSSMVLSEGNLTATNSASAWHTTSGTFYVSSGKWYWEVRNSGGVYQMIGIVADSFDDYTDHVGETSNSYSYYNYSADSSARKYNNNTSTSYGDKWVAGDIIGVALDLDAGTLTFYKNNTSQGIAFTGISGTYAPAESQWTSSAIANFGQDSSFAGNETAQGNKDANGKGDFYYSPPSGFLALCSANLPDPAIDPAQDEEPADHFNTVLYTGDGSNGQAITGVGFQPDWLWIKSRSGTAYHELHDSVRGAGKRLFSNETTAEGNVGTVSSFDSDGFTVSRNSAYDGTNQNTVTFVAWNWLAGGSAVTNNDGSVTSSVSANTKAGFSIVTHENGSGTRTVGHGLDSAPELIIEKKIDASGDWLTQTTVIDGTHDYLRLNTTAAKADSSLSIPTATVYSPNVGGGADCLAYCFHSVDGYSKVGLFTGNGSTNGAFVYTGFRPAWVLIKKTGTDGWSIYDNKRETFNVMDTRLSANIEDAEVSGTNIQIDFLSNGFKLRGTGSTINTSGQTYIYLAFAEQPFKYSNAR